MSLCAPSNIGSITKDEAIIYSNSIHLSYDERIHSDFRAPDNNVVDVIDLESLIPTIVNETTITNHTVEVVGWSEDEPIS